MIWYECGKAAFHGCHSVTDQGNDENYDEQIDDRKTKIIPGFMESGLNDKSNDDDDYN
jgi:hypothetical protein